MKSLKKTLLRGLGIVTILYFLFHLFFLWINQHGDSYYYLAFAQYLRTGIFPHLWPYLYAKPTTIASPLYGIILYMFMSVTQNADILLHIYQLGMLAVSAYLLYRLLIAASGVTKPVALLIAYLFTMLPTSVIYATYNMTEMTAQALFLVFLWYLVRLIKRPTISGLSILVLLSSVLTLAKYQFFVLFLVSSTAMGIVTIIPLLKLSHIIPMYGSSSKKRMIASLVPACAGIILMASWVYVNWHMTGVIGLSDTTKLRFHASMVQDGKITPPPGDPSIQAYYSVIPTQYPLTSPWWDIQEFILKKYGRDWRKVDEIVGNVGIAAAKAYPLSYITNSARIALALHTSPMLPWWDNLSSIGGGYHRLPLLCGRYDRIRLCEQIIKFPEILPLWRIYLTISATLYTTLLPVFMIGIFLPSLVLSLLFGNNIIRTFAALYCIQILMIATSVFTDTRYVVIFYPLIIILVAAKKNIPKRVAR